MPKSIQNDKGCNVGRLNSEDTLGKIVIEFIDGHFSIAWDDDVAYLYRIGALEVAKHMMIDSARG